jgi:peptide/nickel transport system permease protein
MSLRRDPVVVVAVVLLVLVVAGAAFADVVAAVLGVSADAVDPAHRFADASGAHWLGTDALGRDLFVRLLMGARVSVVVAVVAALVATAIGVVVGAVAAVRGGVVDGVLMRIVDGLVALPSLPLVMMFAAVDVGHAPSSTMAVTRVIALLSSLSWMTTARLVRAQARHALTLDHVAAARALGASEWRVVVVHVLPLGLPAVIVQATLEAAGNLVAEGALSFLGLGVPPPLASWGNMLTGALDVVTIDAPTVLLPGVLLFLTAAALQLGGDALRTALLDGARGGAGASQSAGARGVGTSRGTSDVSTENS